MATSVLYTSTIENMNLELIFFYLYLKNFDCFNELSFGSLCKAAHSAMIAYRKRMTIPSSSRTLMTEKELERS